MAFENMIDIRYQATLPGGPIYFGETRLRKIDDTRFVWSVNNVVGIGSVNTDGDVTIHSQYTLSVPGESYTFYVMNIITIGDKIIFSNGHRYGEVGRNAHIIAASLSGYSLTFGNFLNPLIGYDTAYTDSFGMCALSTDKFMISMKGRTGKSVYCSICTLIGLDITQHNCYAYDTWRDSPIRPSSYKYLGKMDRKTVLMGAGYYDGAGNYLCEYITCSYNSNNVITFVGSGEAVTLNSHEVNDTIILNDREFISFTKDFYGRIVLWKLSTYKQPVWHAWYDFQGLQSADYGTDTALRIGNNSILVNSDTIYVGWPTSDVYDASTLIDIQYYKDNINSLPYGPYAPLYPPYAANYSTSAIINFNAPDYGNSTTGFRVVKTGTLREGMAIYDSIFINGYLLVVSREAIPQNPTYLVHIGTSRWKIDSEEYVIDEAFHKWNGVEISKWNTIPETFPN